VLGGGWLVDRAGGYGQHARCLRVLANYTVAGMALAVGIALVENALVVIVLIWALLVVGGAVLAPATGILLTAAPARVRTFGSAIATMAYNVLGYCLAPLLSGLVIEHYGIRWGFRFVVSIVALSCASLFAAIVAADAVDDAASAARARDAADVERSFALVRMLDGSFAVKAGKPASSARVDHLL
jgi:MFS family permease